MHVLTRFSLRKAPIIIMLMALVLFGGVTAATQLKSELLPDIEFPVVSLVTVYPGAAPDDVRRDVTEPIEKIIAGTANMKTLTSYSNDSVSFVTAEYAFGTNMEKTQQSLQDSINRLTLPTQVQRPNISRSNFQDIPVIVYTVNTDNKTADALVDLRSKLENKLVPELKAIQGVNSVLLAGGGTKKVVIILDDKKLSEKGVTASSVTGLLQANNISFPTGQIVSGGQAIPVRVTNQFASVDDLRNLVIKSATSGASSGDGAPAGGPPSSAGAASGPPFGSSNAGGPPSGNPQAGPQGAPQGGGQASGSENNSKPKTMPSNEVKGQNSKPPSPAPAVKLSDVASVELANANTDSVSRSNGKPSLSLIIYKSQNANTVQVADAVNKRVDELKKDVPSTETVVLFDSSTWIKDSLNGLIREGLSGAVLAILVILLFLRSIKSTFVTALSIPLSLLIALIMLNVFNVSLNIMSLAGLAVAIGRVVDDSIVVLENIYRHHFQRGESLRDAAFNGTKEVATAITSSTITTVCVFLPLGFIAGLVSEFFRPFAVAVTVSLLASLIVALTVIPVLAAFFLKTGIAKAGNRVRDEGVEERSGGKLLPHPIPSPNIERDTFVQKVYTPTITWVLKNGWTKSATLAFALVLFVGSLALTPFIGFSFINFGSDKVLSATIKMKPGTDLTTTSNTAAALETEVQKHPNVRNYQTTIGSNAGAAASGFVRLGDNSSADMTITLDRSVDVRAEADWFRNLINSQSSKLSIESYSVTTGTGGGPNSSNFSAIISGSNYDNVVKTSDALVAKLKNVKDLTNVNSDAARAKPEIRVNVNPAKALEHGSTTIQIAGQVRNLLTSQKVTDITIGGKSYDVEATYDPGTLNSLDAIKAIKVGASNPVPLGDIAEVTSSDGPVSITRINQERSVSVNGTITSDSTSGVTVAAQQAINELNPGAGTKVTIAGVSQQQSEAFGQLGTALLIAVVLVYMVMVLTFGSLSTPFVIMFSVPLAAIGSIVALFVTGRPLGVSALIGVLMLVGIVVTNAIVLLDLVEQYKHRGLNTHDALIQGGRTRVRPILMTAIATMLALMPLVLGFSEGSIIAAELGTVVVGGLFTSTFLTLIIIPALYSLLDGLRSRFGGGSNKQQGEEVVSHNGVQHDVLDDLDKTAPVQPLEASPFFKVSSH